MEEIKKGYTRVSTILSSMPSFVDGKFTFPLQNINTEVLSRKAEVGSNVHKAIEAHIKGDFFPLNDQEQGYFQSYLLWEKQAQLLPMETELRLYDEPTKITGCVDMMAQVGGDRESVLIDFKCTVAEDPKKWPLQAAAYSWLLASNRFGMCNK